MATITRKSGETIHIGDHTTVTVTRIKGGRTTLRIDAPSTERILRGELYEEEAEARLRDIPLNT